MLAQGHMQYGIKRNAGVGFWSWHKTLHFTAGWRFDKHHYLGLGSGCDWIDIGNDADPELSNGEVKGVPLFVDYVYYTPFRHFPKHAFFFGIEGGGGIYTGDLPTKDDSQRFFPYFNPKLGLDFTIHKNFGLNFGFCEILSERQTVLCVQVGLRF